MSSWHEGDTSSDWYSLSRVLGVAMTRSSSMTRRKQRTPYTPAATETHMHRIASTGRVQACHTFLDLSCLVMMACSLVQSCLSFSADLLRFSRPSYLSVASGRLVEVHAIGKMDDDSDNQGQDETEMEIARQALHLLDEPASAATLSARRTSLDRSYTMPPPSWEEGDQILKVSHRPLNAS